MSFFRVVPNRCFFLVESRFQNKFPLVGFLGQSKSLNSCLIFQEFIIIGLVAFPEYSFEEQTDHMKRNERIDFEIR